MFETWLYISEENTAAADAFFESMIESVTCLLGSQRWVEVGQSWVVLFVLSFFLLGIFILFFHS